MHLGDFSNCRKKWLVILPSSLEEKSGHCAENYNLAYLLITHEKQIFCG